jgi:hypothetical protein
MVLGGAGAGGAAGKGGKGGEGLKGGGSDRFSSSKSACTTKGIF